MLSGLNVVAFAADDDLTDTVDIYGSYYQGTGFAEGDHLYGDEARIKDSLNYNYVNEGVKWVAPIYSDVVVASAWNSATGEHLFYLSNPENEAFIASSPVWQKDEAVIYGANGLDENAIEVYRMFNPAATMADTHIYKTEAEQADIETLKGLGYVFETDGGQTTEQVPYFYGYNKEEPAAEVKLVCEAGLQSDGTALTTDLLSLEYGSDFGTPSSITWYRNGTVAGVFSGATVNFGLDCDSLRDNNGEIKEGIYYVIIENTKGQTFTTNNIIVSADQSLAILSDVMLTEDYSHDDGKAAENIVYDAETNKLVVTVTVNRADYEGVFALIPTEKVISGEATAADIVAAAPVMSETTFKKVTTLKDFTDAAAIAEATKFGVQMSNHDGSVTYKWCVDTTTADLQDFSTPAALTRGTSYMLGFYQDGVSDIQDLTTLAIGGMVDAPYVDAPIGISIASVGINGDATIQVGLAELGEEGIQKASWMGGSDALESIGGTLDVYGSKDNKISIDEYDAKASAPAAAMLGGMVGQIGAGALNDSEYFMAVLTLDEGIYGEDEVVLVSEVAEPAQDAAAGLKATYNPASDDFNPYAIVATVDTSFKANGTVELYRNTSKAAWTNGVDLTDKSKATKIDEVEVSKGESTAEFRLAVTQLYTQTGGNQYAVRFVPDDTTTWKTVNATADCTEFTGDIATVIELPASLTLDKTVWDPATAATGQAIKVTNQFGKEVTGDISAAAMGLLPNGETMKVDVVTAGSDIVPTVTISNTKLLKVACTGNKSAVGDTYKLTLKNGQTVYAQVKTIDNNDMPETWTLWIE